MLLTTFLAGPKSRASLPIIHFVRTYTVLADAPVPKKKVWDSVDSAVEVVKSGDVLLSGGTVCRWAVDREMLIIILGFGLCGTPGGLSARSPDRILNAKFTPQTPWSVHLLQEETCGT